MQTFRPKLPLHALWICSALMAGCTSPGYNDNPSQQATDARVGCRAATDFFAVYFSVHVQPTDESQAATITKEVFRSYCNHVPTTGKIFFTADLVGPELRRIPIGIRVVERGAGGVESLVGNVEERDTVAQIPPKTYAGGVIESQFELDRSGSYAIRLARGGESAVSEEDELQIPLNVGVVSGADLSMARMVSVLGIAAGLAVAGLAAFRIMRRRM